MYEDAHQWWPPGDYGMKNIEESQTEGFIYYSYK